MTNTFVELDDISPDFHWNKSDAKIIAKILPYEATPEAIRLFARHSYKLTNSAYWFVLSTLWVSYTGENNLGLWKNLFSSSRPLRETSIMKPSELRAFHVLPNVLMVYRAHRPGEADWISYSVLPEKAAEFAVRYGIDKVKAYRVAKADVLCLFLRRRESEVLVLDKKKAEYMRTIDIILMGRTR